MIFENTPRGVFRKIRHLFIFTAGYGIFYFLILGGIVFPNIPITYVPFNSNMAVVSVYDFEEKTEEEYSEIIAKRNDTMLARDNYGGEYEGSDVDVVYTETSDEMYRWQIIYEDDIPKYFYRKSEVVSYIVTDKEYLKNISRKLAEESKIYNANSLHRVLIAYFHQ